MSELKRTHDSAAEANEYDPSTIWLVGELASDLFRATIYLFTIPLAATPLLAPMIEATYIPELYDPTAPYALFPEPWVTSLVYLLTFLGVFYLQQSIRD